ncbi:MAG TPA: restriction endonuclease subunit S, partial [Dehalococcoidia bacterium]|nr:restriction endonuclease subunit S [Dehalococcoidia bacterium]
MRHDGAVLEGWRTARLGDVASITMGQAPPGTSVNEDGDGLPFIQGNTEFGSRHPRPVKWCSEPWRRALAGDVLISVRAPVGALNIADAELANGRGISAVRVEKL